MTPHNNPARGFLLYKSDEPYLARLSPVSRSAIERTTNDGMKYEDLATEQNVSVGTVKSRVHRARARILSMRAKAARKESGDGA